MNGLGGVYKFMVFSIGLVMVCVVVICDSFDIIFIVFDECCCKLVENDDYFEIGMNF